MRILSVLTTSAWDRGVGAEEAEAEMKGGVAKSTMSPFMNSSGGRASESMGRGNGKGVVPSER